MTNDINIIGNPEISSAYSDAHSGLALSEPMVVNADTQLSLFLDPMNSDASSHTHHHHRTLDENGQPIKHKHHKKHSERKKKKKDDEIIDPALASNELQQNEQSLFLNAPQPAKIQQSSVMEAAQALGGLSFGVQGIIPPQQSLHVNPLDGSAGFYHPEQGYGHVMPGSAVAADGEHKKEPKKRERGKRNETHIKEFGNPIFAPLFFKNVVVYADGFKSERVHQSYKDPKTKCKYLMSIKAEDSHPTFTISCEDDPGNVFRSNSISDCLRR